MKRGMTQKIKLLFTLESTAETRKIAATTNRNFMTVILPNGDISHCLSA
jgi:hypothetical protein